MLVAPIIRDEWRMSHCGHEIDISPYVTLRHFSHRVGDVTTAGKIYQLPQIVLSVGNNYTPSWGAPNNLQTLKGMCRSHFSNAWQISTQTKCGDLVRTTRIRPKNAGPDSLWCVKSSGGLRVTWAVCSDATQARVWARN